MKTQATARSTICDSSSIVKIWLEKACAGSLPWVSSTCE